MAINLIEGRYVCDWLKQENVHYSREEVVIASGAGKLVSGTVVGKITASGKYKAVTIGAADGSQNAAGIVMWAGDATSADAKAVIVARDAIVVHQGLKFGADVTTSGNRLTVKNALQALNPPILVREGA